MMPSGEVVVRLGEAACTDSGLDEKAHAAPAMPAMPAMPARNKRLRISVSIFGIAHSAARDKLLVLVFRGITTPRSNLHTIGELFPDGRTRHVYLLIRRWTGVSKMSNSPAHR
jgi:hypothetical protein